MEYLALKRVFENLHQTPGLLAYVDFDNEIAGTSTQCAVWGSALPDGARTPSGKRVSRTTGPTITIGADGLDNARWRAVRGLLDQLVATLSPGQYPSVAGWYGAGNQ